MEKDVQNYISYVFVSLDPWDRRKKKGKKQKKPAKKRLSTQDKIQSMLVHKQSSNKNKRNGDTAISGPMSVVGGGMPHNQAPPRDAIERACSMKEELLSQIEILGDRLPPNTLDQLIDELGGPENVAEMTGRKGRVVQREDGGIEYESRSEVDVPLETLNLTEKQRCVLNKNCCIMVSILYALIFNNSQIYDTVYNDHNSININLLS